MLVAFYATQLRVAQDNYSATEQLLCHWTRGPSCHEKYRTFCSLFVWL